LNPDVQLDCKSGRKDMEKLV